MKKNCSVTKVKHFIYKVKDMFLAHRFIRPDDNLMYLGKARVVELSNP